MKDIKESLSEILLKSKAAPILFIGSGISRRYLGTEDWSSLLKKFSEGLSKDYTFYEKKSKNYLPDVIS